VFPLARGPSNSATYRIKRPVLLFAHLVENGISDPADGSSSSNVIVELVVRWVSSQRQTQDTYLHICPDTSWPTTPRAHGPTSAHGRARGFQDREVSGVPRCRNRYKERFDSAPSFAL